jgi:hypothetical protein
MEKDKFKPTPPNYHDKIHSGRKRIHWRYIKYLKII